MPPRLEWTAAAGDAQTGATAAVFPVALAKGKEPGN